MADGTDIMGGQETLATVLFSDVRSFTTIPRPWELKEPLLFLNEYFDIMVEAISNKGGWSISLLGML